MIDFVGFNLFSLINFVHFLLNNRLFLHLLRTSFLFDTHRNKIFFDIKWFLVDNCILIDADAISFWLRFLKLLLILGILRNFTRFLACF